MWAEFKEKTFETYFVGELRLLTNILYAPDQLLASRFNVDAVLHRAVRAAVNNEFVPESHVIRPGDTVEFLSPVSGG